MKITLNTIMKTKLFENARLIAGKGGLDNEIKYVDVAEVPDIKKWLRKGTFLLTTGYLMKDNKKVQEKYILAFIEAGIAALGIKVGRFIDEIPDYVVEIANKKNFPIIQLPKEIAYIDVINLVLGMVLKNQSYIIDKTNRIHNQLDKLILLSKGSKSIINMINKEIKKDILLLDNNFNVLEKSGDHKRISSFKEKIIPKLSSYKINISRKIRIEGVNILATPVKVKDISYGYIICIDIEDDEEYFKIYLEMTATNICIENLKKKIEVETEIRTRGDIIYNVLLGNTKNKDVVRNLARSIQWDLNKRYFVAVMTIEKIEIENLDYNYINLINIVKRCLREYNCSGIITCKIEKIIILIDCSDIPGKNEKNYMINVCTRISEELNAVYKKVVHCGIGNGFYPLKGLDIGYNQALMALDIANLKTGISVKHYNDVELYAFLKENISMESLIYFHEKHLNLLVEYDKKRNVDYLNTLRVYFESNGNNLLCSKRLFIHRNTLKARLSKIEDILNKKLDNYNDRLYIQLALVIHDIIK